MKNLKYKTREHFMYMATTRSKWDGFYPSERWVFEKVAGQKKSLGSVLDIGCATGGLGLALAEKLSFTSYTGIDINKEAIDFANKTLKLPAPTSLIAGDVLDVNLGSQGYDTVFSLSCADWNIETSKIIEAGWKNVAPGGNFVISVRLTNNQGINDIKKSFQYINPHVNLSAEKVDSEIANYVVFNAKSFLATMGGLEPAPELIGAYGYWGKPSSTAVTPFKKLVFAVFFIRKAKDSSSSEVQVDLNLPLDVLV